MKVFLCVCVFSRVCLSLNSKLKYKSDVRAAAAAEEWTSHDGTSCGCHFPVRGDQHAPLQGINLFATKM
jgi:hypothetical protein